MISAYLHKLLRHATDSQLQRFTPHAFSWAAQSPQSGGSRPQKAHLEVIYFAVGTKTLSAATNSAFGTSVSSRTDW
jgi:hypothetical protein